MVYYTCLFCSVKFAKEKDIRYEDSKNYFNYYNYYFPFLNYIYVRDDGD